MNIHEHKIAAGLTIDELRVPGPIMNNSGNFMFTNIKNSSLIKLCLSTDLEFGVPQQFRNSQLLQ